LLLFAVAASTDLPARASDNRSLDIGRFAIKMRFACLSLEHRATRKAGETVLVIDVDNWGTGDRLCMNRGG
jgi:hypothetical protein